MTAAAAGAREAYARAEALWLLPVTLLCLGLFLVAQAVGYGHGMSPVSMLSAYGGKALRVLPLVLAVTLIVQLLLSMREAPHAPLAAFTARVRRLLEDRWMIAARIAPLLLMPVLFVAFSSLKMLMPRFVPFWLDDSFAAIDRMLFFGEQPWRLTHALFGSIEATLVIDRLYSFWVLLLSIAIVGMAFFARRADRAHFFIAFALAWVLLGVVGAWIGASAGPCYAALIGAASAPEFAPLMTRLASLSIETGGAINAPGWQEVLWRAHDGEIYAFGMGISAMPSLHNAIAALYAFAAFRLGRLFGWIMTGYAMLIFIGSIHLGWHYAVDGIVGALAMAAIWGASGRFLQRSGYFDAVAAEEESRGRPEAPRPLPA